MGLVGGLPETLLPEVKGPTEPAVPAEAEQPLGPHEVETEAGAEAGATM